MSITIRSAQTIHGGVKLRGNDTQVISPPSLPILFELDASTYSSPLSTWEDISGNGRHATLHGTVPYYTDTVGGYFGFSGNGANYIDIAGSNSGWGFRDIIPPSATFSVWTNITPANYYQAVAGWRNGGFNFYFLMLNGTPGITTEARFDGNSGSSDIVIDYTSYFNTWVYVTFVVDSTQSRLYINGTLVGTASIAGNWTTDNTLFEIGQFYGGDFPLHGYIGGAIAYSRALTQEEVTAEFNRTKTRYGL
jgi:hypothetical protein